MFEAGNARKLVLRYGAHDYKNILKLQECFMITCYEFTILSFQKTEKVCIFWKKNSSWVYSYKHKQYANLFIFN